MASGFSFSFRLLLATLALLSATVSAAGNPAVLALCKKTSFPNLCYSAATRVYKNRPLTAADAARASILVTIDSTRQAKALASAMKARCRDAISRANFNVCRQMYDDAIRNLKISLKNLGHRALADLKINLSAAISDYTTCDDGFNERPGVRSPLAKVNQQLNMLTSNNLALASALHQGRGRRRMIWKIRNDGTI